MKLYSYWRSSAAYRLRIVMNLKGVAHETRTLDLATGGQHEADYVALNPGHSVPTLVTDDGLVLTQSLAAIDWLDASYPDAPMLPRDPALRARVMQAAMAIAVDVHPVNNLRVLQYLRGPLGHAEDDVLAWMGEWMGRGFDAVTAQIDPATPFCFGEAPTLADICLIPQLYNAHRWGIDLTRWPRLTGIEAHCLALPAFDAARPENQPDAPPC